jgi:hypothetical protein
MRKKPAIVLTVGSIAIVALVVALVVSAAATTTVADRASDDPPAEETATAELYAQVLRRYLTTPQENSFPAGTFTTAYVLDRTTTGAGNPNELGATGPQFPPRMRDMIKSALADVVRVEFVGSRDAAMDPTRVHAEVKPGGILITLGPADGGARRTLVGIEGFVAPDGATWLTYVARNDGAGWRVTGTTGGRSIA